MTPNEAWAEPSNSTLKKLNSESKYKNEFSRHHRETFNKNDQVYIEGSEIEAKEKINSKYEELGIVIEILEKDSYLVQNLKTGKIVKKSHSQLKKFCNP